MAKASLEKWITEALGSNEYDGPCKAIVLCHIVGQQPKEIDSLSIAEGNSYEAKQLASRFRLKATNYCAELPGVQQFQLAAFYGKSQEPKQFQPFTVNVEADTNGLYTEAPTDQGRIQQGMRHQEAVFQQTYRKQQHLDEMQMRMFELMSRDNASLRHDNMEGFSIIKELLMERSNNEHKHSMEQLEYSRKTEERKKWMGFLPVLINTLLGDEIFPQSTADTALIESIALSLKPDQLQKLMDLNLPPEVMGPIANRIAMAHEKREAEQTRMKQLPKPRMTGEQDLSGGAEE